MGGNVDFDEKVLAGDEAAIETRKKYRVAELASVNDIKAKALGLLRSRDMSSLHDAIVLVFNCAPDTYAEFRLVMQFQTTNLTPDEKFDAIVNEKGKLRE